MSRRHLRPVPGPPPLPDYPTHEGRQLTWDAWREGGTVFVCSRSKPLPPRECAQCGSGANPWFTAARAYPLPGETFTDLRPRAKGHQDGMPLKQVRVPAWPLYKVCAFACPDCQYVELYSYSSARMDDFAPIPYMNPTLF
ncbi:hypothetical protein ACWFMI_23785 [Nocardiopsis terrae]|uniref:hypothetical protein n=1 Tax=Streptomyces sp. NPDC057554 TaxID=3350538 RepID=UPI0036D13B53